MESIRITPGFCPNCGSILPYLKGTGNVKCYNCLTDWPPEGKHKYNFVFILSCVLLIFLLFCFSVW